MKSRPVIFRIASRLASIALVCSVACPGSRDVFAADPVSAPPATFYTVDDRGLDRGSRLLLASLQALANSNAPVLFVGEQGSTWHRAMEKQLRHASEILSLDEALSRFGAEAPQVIYDPERRWTLSIATTAAGVHRALLSDHPLDGRAIALDCRGRWTDKVEAYRWALKELAPKCNRTQLCYLDEQPITLRDYAIQHRLFVLNLNPLSDSADSPLLDEILSKFPPQTRVFGWAKGAFAGRAQRQSGVSVEAALVSRLSKRGLMLVPADFAGNLSFYCRTGPYLPEIAQQQRLQRELKFQPGKRYVLLVISDGDNLQYDLGTMRQHWLEDRPTIPLAWTISPQLAGVAPAVLRTYYEEAAERGGWDEFIAGPSGAGYVNPGSMNTVHLYEFVRRTREACDQSDLRSIAVLDEGWRPAAPVLQFIRAYAHQKFDALWLMAMPRFVGISSETAYLNERFRLGRDNAAEVAQRVKEARALNPFILVYVDGWSPPGRMLREFQRNLDDSCVLVSATEMARLMREPNALAARPLTGYSKATRLEARPALTDGLAPLSGGDGAFRMDRAEGFECWRLPRNYFYWDVDDGFGPPAKTVLEIEVEYFDSGEGELTLEYDSTDPAAHMGGAYKRHPTTIRRANTGAWTSARFQLSDYRFRGAQNLEADFRFANGGDDLLIRAVIVRIVNR